MTVRVSFIIIVVVPSFSSGGCVDVIFADAAGGGCIVRILVLVASGVSVGVFVTSVEGIINDDDVVVVVAFADGFAVVVLITVGVAISVVASSLRLIGALRYA